MFGGADTYEGTAKGGEGMRERRSCVEESFAAEIKGYVRQRRKKKIQHFERAKRDESQKRTENQKIEGVTECMGGGVR